MWNQDLHHALVPAWQETYNASVLPVESEIYFLVAYLAYPIFMLVLKYTKRLKFSGFNRQRWILNKNESAPLVYLMPKNTEFYLRVSY